MEFDTERESVERIVEQILQRLVSVGVIRRR
jgi:hypothetical protein